MGECVVWKNTLSVCSDMANIRDSRSYSSNRVVISTDIIKEQPTCLKRPRLIDYHALICMVHVGVLCRLSDFSQFFSVTFSFSVYKVEKLGGAWTIFLVFREGLRTIYSVLSY